MDLYSIILVELVEVLSEIACEILEVALVQIWVYVPSLKLNYGVYTMTWGLLPTKDIAKFNWCWTLKCVVTSCKEENIQYHSCSPSVKAIRVLLSQDWLVETSHIHREANHSANCIAKQRHHHMLCIIFYSSLPSLACVAFMADRMGCSFPRRLALYFAFVSLGLAPK